MAGGPGTAVPRCPLAGAGERAATRRTLAAGGSPGGAVQCASWWKACLGKPGRWTRWLPASGHRRPGSGWHPGFPLEVQRGDNAAASGRSRRRGPGGRAGWRHRRRNEVEQRTNSPRWRGTGTTAMTTAMRLPPPPRVVVALARTVTLGRDPRRGVPAAWA